MTPGKSCHDHQEALLAGIVGALEPSEARALQEHLARCETCRRLHQRLQAEEREVEAGFGLLAQALAPVPQVLLQPVPQEPLASTTRRPVSYPSVWQRVQNMITQHKRLSTATAAAILAASLLVYFLVGSSVGIAYALEQTIEASQKVVRYHIKSTRPAESSSKEAWLESDAEGHFLRLRMDFRDRDGGPKVYVATPEQVDVWYPEQQQHAILRDPAEIKKAAEQRVMFDPKLAFEQIEADQKAGRAQVTTETPAKPGDPIVLTVTSLARAERKTVYRVSSESKLVLQREDFERKNGEWALVGTVEYLDYNQPIDPQVFQYQLPGEVATTDYRNTQWGLPQGDLSDKEIAKKVAREFLEALIAKDYAKAARLTRGGPEEELRRRLQKHPATFLRIQELGEPYPGPTPDSLSVPAQVELEVNGKKMIHSCNPHIRRVPDQKDRWGFDGGV